MIWKYELIVTDKKIANELKKALLNIDSDIVVQIDKNGYNYNVKTSIQKVKSDLDYKNDIIRKVKAVYNDFRSKIYENKNSNLKLLENMIRKIVLENISERDSLLYHITSHLSSGTLGNYINVQDYKTIDAVRKKMISMLQKDGDQQYSISALKNLANQAKRKLNEGKNKLTESTDISSAIDSYVEKLNAFEKKSFEDDGYTIPSGVFEKSVGKSWIKITTTTLGGKGQKSVFCFIDPKTGDIYKPAGWNAPAKGVRGNVLDKNPPLTLRQLYR